MKTIIIAVLASIASYFVVGALGSDYAVSITFAITLLTAILWITEVIPIPVASLVPFVGFPIAGILTHKQAASALGSHVILLLTKSLMQLGGF